MVRRFSLLVIAAVVAAAAASVAQAAGPPGGVYTCRWIAANPAAAAAAQVSCGVSSPAATTSSVSPLAPGAQPFAIGCQRVPGSGSVGQGVFAWSAFEYAGSWSWSVYGNPQVISPYTWYLQKTNGTNYAHGSNNGSIGVPANVYRWGAQNNGPVLMAWQVCYSG
jgi:hypothetical protein